MSVKYRPDSDELRAAAVIAVTIYHYFPNILPSGYIGVDVFFVISGFSITLNTVLKKMFRSLKTGFTI